MRLHRQNEGLFLRTIIDMMIEEKDIYTYLMTLGISDYKVAEHPPLHSVQDAVDLGVHMPGLNFKNLLIKDKKTGGYFLVIIEESRHMDNKYFKTFTGWGKIRFAHPEELWDIMGLRPGSVSPYGLLNDRNHDITVVIDRCIRSADADTPINFHPNRNTATLTVNKNQFVKFLESLGNSLIWEPEKGL